MKCCENCIHYIRDYCTKDWNNMDQAYKVEERDYKKPDECCDDWEYNEMEE